MSCNLSYNASITGDCTNTNSGLFTIDIIGDAPDYTIQWLSPSATTISLGVGVTAYTETNLSAGTYSFNIIDSCIPNTVIPVNIYISSGTCVSISNVNNTVCSLNNGSLTAVTSDFYGSPVFSLYNDISGLISTFYPAENFYVFDNLSVGTYYVIADDGGGCTGKSESVVVQNSSNLSFEFYTVDNAGCSGNSGKIFITGLSGTPPYTYLWSNGGTTDSISGLSEGTYSATVTDGSNCSVSNTTTISTVPPVGLGTIFLTQPSCFTNDGAVEIIITGGTAPFYYLGSNGVTYTTFDRNVTFPNVGPGGFTIQVVDAGLCTFTTSTNLLTPNGISTVSVSVSASTCNDLSGIINVAVNGGASPYTFILTNSLGYTGSTVVSQPNWVFNNLSGGTYTLSVTSSSSTCPFTGQYTIDNIVKFELSTSTTGTTCNSGDGSVTLQITDGGLGPYKYEINGQSLAFSQSVSNILSNSYTFNNLFGGNYSASVTDSTLCKQTTFFTINQSNTVDFHLLGVDSTNNNGSISVYITNGTPPFTVYFNGDTVGTTDMTFNNLSAGDYSVRVVDNVGCSKTKTITIKGLSDYSSTGYYSVCEGILDSSITLHSGPKQFLNEGYNEALLSNPEYSNCRLTGATFEAIVTIGDCVQTSGVFFTSTGLLSYPSDEEWFLTIDSLIESCPQIGPGNVIIDELKSTITINTNCESESLHNSDVLVEMRIEYQIECVCPQITPTPTPTVTPTLTPTVTPTPTTACPSCVGTEIEIGTQFWTVCNAEHTTYSDGITPIPEVTGTTDWTGLTTGAWCYYANVTSNGTTYGKLYNWYAVAGIYDEASLLTPSLRKQFAPTDYHVPSDTEWTVLTDYLGGDSISGGKMKQTGFCNWASPNSGATNESGFTGLPGGVRLFNGTFTSINTSGYWWSSTDFSTDSSWYRGLNYEFINTGTYGNKKTYGLSVRLIKDSLPSCAVLYNDNDDKVWAYNVVTGDSIELTMPSQYSGGFDIAHTSNKLWEPGGTSFYEYNLTLSPFTATFNREIIYPSGFSCSAGLAAISDDVILAVNNSTSPIEVVEINISGVTTGVMTTKFPLIIDRSISNIESSGITGDFFRTTTDKFLALNYVDVTVDFDIIRYCYLTQWDYSTGMIEVDINLNERGIINCATYGIFESNGNIYISDTVSTTSTNVYLINTSFPYGLTLVDNVVNYIAGASQIPTCLTVNLNSPSSSPTPTPTMTQTPTMTITPTQTPTPTPTSPISPIQEYCVNWTASNDGNIKMSTQGYIDFTVILSGRTIEPGPASVGTITGFVVVGGGVPIEYSCNISMDFTSTRATWNTDALLPIPTDNVLTSLIYSLEVIFSDLTDYSFTGQTNAEVIPGGQLTSEYNDCSVPPTPVACYRVRGGLNITPCSAGFDAFAAIGSNTFVVGDIVQYVRTVDFENVICGEIISTTELQVPDSYIYSPIAVDVCGNPTFCDIPNPG